MLFRVVAKYANQDLPCGEEVERRVIDAPDAPSAEAIYRASPASRFDGQEPLSVTVEAK